MQDNTAEKDPWAKLGNTIGNKTSEVTPEGLAREASWNAAMADAPEFTGDQLNEAGIPNLPDSYETTVTEPTDVTAEEAPKRDENIADASAIINYGLNAASHEKGVEQVIQTINNFVSKGDEDPIEQLFNDLDIDTKTELKDTAEEARAAKPEENAFRSEDINAPATINKSHEGALAAIQNVKDLVTEVQTSPAYADLRAEALSSGLGVFEYAVKKYAVRDLTVLFRALSEQKQEYEQANKKSAQTAEEPTEKPAEQPEEAPEKTPQEAQTENQFSTTNSSPETDATASNGFKSVNLL